MSTLTLPSLAFGGAVAVAVNPIHPWAATTTVIATFFLVFGIELEAWRNRRRSNP